MGRFLQLGKERDRFLRAQVASGVATLGDWLVLTALIGAGLHYLTAAAVGALAGAAIDFHLKKFWAFRAKGALVREAPRYVAVALGSAGLNTLVAWLAVGKAGLPRIDGVVAASVVVALLWNYPLQRLFVFRRLGEKTAAGAAPSGGHPRRTSSRAG